MASTILIRSTALWLLVVPALATTAGTTSIDELKWLAGCWATDNAETGTGEQWMQPAGGSMNGMARVVRSGQESSFEFMRITESDDGGLVFTAMPSGQSAADFTLIDIGPHKVVFENANHDFPQRVIYLLEDNNRLIGRIEGVIDGDQRSIDFPMTRIACDLPFRQD